MNFRDIDFSKVAQMLNSMSDEEKDNLQKMAQDMMDKKVPQEEAAEEEDVDLFEFLKIPEEKYTDLPGTVLDQMEAAVDLEVYYEDEDQADFAASILFYAKAVLNLLRKYHYDMYTEVFGLSMSTSTTTLYSYLAPLMQEEAIHNLVDAGYGASEDWTFHKDMLQKLTILLSRAEYDVVGYEEIQMLKEVLFKQEALLNIVQLVR